MKLFFLKKYFQYLVDTKNQQQKNGRQFLTNTAIDSGNFRWHWHVVVYGFQQTSVVIGKILANYGGGQWYQKIKRQVRTCARKRSSNSQVWFDYSFEKEKLFYEN